MTEMKRPAFRLRRMSLRSGAVRGNRNAAARLRLSLHGMPALVGQRVQHVDAGCRETFRLTRGNPSRGADRRQWRAEHLLVLRRLRRQGLWPAERPPRHHSGTRRYPRRYLLAPAGRPRLHAQRPAVGATRRRRRMLRDHARGFLVACREVASDAMTSPADEGGHAFYGFRIDAPVVARLSRSIWAFAASFSA